MMAGLCSSEKLFPIRQETLFQIVSFHSGVSMGAGKSFGRPTSLVGIARHLQRSRYDGPSSQSEGSVTCQMEHTWPSCSN